MPPRESTTTPPRGSTTAPPRDPTTTPLPEPATRVPADEDPVASCPYCERPFRSDHARDLHVGELHEAVTDDELDRYERALEAERDDLWLFHAKAVVALGTSYAATVVLYMVVLGSNIL